jgi:hypothetical protein
VSEAEESSQRSTGGLNIKPWWKVFKVEDEFDFRELELPQRVVPGVIA